jgi:beta-glucanase (GH16 family)
MEDDAGRHITNLDKTVIDLGFDASAGFHTYDIVLTGTSAVFRVDGEVIHEFTAEDMPGNVWRTGELKSVVDLWAADARYDKWTGHWTDPGVPLWA